MACQKTRKFTRFYNCQKLNSHPLSLCELPVLSLPILLGTTLASPQSSATLLLRCKPTGSPDPPARTIRAGFLFARFLEWVQHKKESCLLQINFLIKQEVLGAMKQRALCLAMSLWMIAVPAIAFWTTKSFLLKEPSFLKSSTLLSITPYFWSGMILTVLILALVACVGLLNLAEALLFQVERCHFVSFGRIFRSAWLVILRNRWILRLTALVAVMIMFIFVIEAFLTPGWRMGTHGNVYSAGRIPGSFMYSLISMVVAVIADFECFFIPVRLLTVGTRYGVGFALLILAAASKLNKSLKSLSFDPEYTREARKLQAMILPLAIISVSLIVSNLLSTPGHQNLLRGESPVSGTTEILSVLNQIVEYVYVIIVQALIFCGLAGSLGRLKRGAPVTADTFLKDVVRYFRPVTLIYIVVLALPWLVNILGDLVAVHWASAKHPAPIPPRGLYLLFTFSDWWRLVFLPLLFAPYAAIFWGNKPYSAIRTGMIHWVSNAWYSISFTLFVASLLAPVLAVDRLLSLHGWYGSASWLYPLVQILLICVRALIVLLIITCFWELYWHLAERHSPVMGKRA